MLTTAVWIVGIVVGMFVFGVLAMDVVLWWARRSANKKDR